MSSFIFTLGWWSNYAIGAVVPKPTRPTGRKGLRYARRHWLGFPIGRHDVRLTCGPILLRFVPYMISVLSCMTLVKQTWSAYRTKISYQFLVDAQAVHFTTPRERRVPITVEAIVNQVLPCRDSHRMPRVIPNRYCTREFAIFITHGRAICHLY